MKTIVVIDDSATIQMSLKGILDKGDFAVQTANDGQEALDKFTSGLKPDLIITDINMPRMNGIELISAARKLPGFRFLPILVLTTVSQQAMRDKAKAEGATGWLVKPVASKDLLNVIKQVLPGA
jgi:two-component system chemotaxis response regulator CheY